MAGGHGHQATHGRITRGGCARGSRDGSQTLSIAVKHRAVGVRPWATAGQLICPASMRRARRFAAVAPTSGPIYSIRPIGQQTSLPLPGRLSRSPQQIAPGWSSRADEPPQCASAPPHRGSKQAQARLMLATRCRYASDGRPYDFRPRYSTNGLESQTCNRAGAGSGAFRNAGKLSQRSVRRDRWLHRSFSSSLGRERSAKVNATAVVISA